MEVKIPLYNILNMFLTGLIFLGCIILIFPNELSKILESNIITDLSAGPEIIVTVSIFAIAYELGLVINRLGSIAIEPLLKKIKLIPFDNDYQKFNDKKKSYPILDTLSREYAISRTSITLFLVLMIISALLCKWLLFTVFTLICIIYILSCRKHSKKIVQLMNSK